MNGPTTIVVMDHHTVAVISVIGISFDVLGGLYLAYDLLGGQHGPLRLLTRMVTYSAVFGIGYGLGLGVFFGVASGLATGITVALELHRTSRKQRHFSWPVEVLFSAIRSAAFGAGLYRMVGLQFAIAFAAFATVGQVIAYTRGIRPGLDYAASRQARLTRRQLWAVVTRTIGYVAAALICSAWVQHVDHPWAFASRVGLVTGLVTAIGGSVNPYIEYFADNLPARYLGMFGIALLFCGFAVQSVQYWVVILDVPVK
jgi:hypothetical protein